MAVLTVNYTIISDNYLYMVQCGVPEGGIVPKSMYTSISDEDIDVERAPDENVFGVDSIYHTAYVVKDFPHEVLNAM